MGALEFAPALGPKPGKATKIEVDALVRLAGEVLTHRGDLQGHFHADGKEKALRDILRVGTSAVGARAKAVIAWNRATNEVPSGQIAAGDGFDFWLLKFEGEWSLAPAFVRKFFIENKKRIQQQPTVKLAPQPRQQHCPS